MTSEYIHNEALFLQQLAQRNTTAFQWLVETYFPVLCVFAEKIVTDAALAKDTVQETFIRFWNQNELNFENTDSIKSYLYVSVRNGCLNVLRGQERQVNKHQKALEESPRQANDVLQDIVRSETIAQIYQVVNSMPDKMRTIFYLSFEEGLSIQEISQQLHITPKTVSNNRYNALQILKEAFKHNKEGLMLVLTLLHR